MTEHPRYVAPPIWGLDNSDTMGLLYDWPEGSWACCEGDPENQRVATICRHNSYPTGSHPAAIGQKTHAQVRKGETGRPKVFTAKRRGSHTPFEVFHN